MIIKRFCNGNRALKSLIRRNAQILEKLTQRPTCYFSTQSDESNSNAQKLRKIGNKISEADLSGIERERIRNFSIIAHIDHGKSTLADCMLERVEAISKRTKENDRILDKLQVERERGITVKAQMASFIYEVSYTVLLQSSGPVIFLSHINLYLFR